MLIDGDSPTSAWVAHPDVAWVEGEGRVALLDVRRPGLQVQVCPEPAASLWRLMSETVVSEAELLQRAHGLVGEGAEALVDATLYAFSAAGLIERRP